MELFRLDTAHLQTGVLEAHVMRVFQVILDDAAKKLRFNNDSCFI